MVKVQSLGDTTGEGCFSVNKNDKKNFNIKTVCRFGLTDDEIRKAAMAFGANVVVMGMRGAGAISQAVLGSTTIAVIEESKVPVLAVPLDARFSGLSSLVLAVDPEKLPAADTLAPLCDLATAYGSQLFVLQLHKDYTEEQRLELEEKSTNSLQSCLPNQKFQLHASKGEDVATGIQQFLDEKQADLLVLVPRKHSFFSRLRNKSITGQLAAVAKVPLLALP